MINSTRLLRNAAIAGAMMASAGSLDAQTCMGLPSTSYAPVNISGNYLMPPNAKQLEARLGFGGQNAFGGIGVVHTDIDGASKGATSFGGDIGYSVPVNSRKTTQICPMVALQYRSGPDTDIYDVSETRLLAGVAMGGEVDISPNFELVPHASAGILHFRTKAEALNGGLTDNITDTGGQLGVGVSLRFNRIFSITPTVRIPVGFEGDTDPIFGIGMSLGFRGR